MSFTATPAVAFTAGVSTIPATTANTWRANIAASLDTVGGGAYANVATIDWSAGSAGWRFYAAVAIKSTGTLTLDAGATVTINADPLLYGTMRVGYLGGGGSVHLYATSTLTVDDTVACSIAGDVTMTGASTLVHASSSVETHASGSSDTYSAGAVLAINTASATMGQDSVLTINGASGHVAQVIRGQYSTDTYLSGSGLTCNSGSILTVGSGCFVTATIGGGGNAGSLTFGADGTLTVPTTCTTSMAIGADGTFSTAAGASVVMSVGGSGTVGSVTFNADGTLETTASADFNNGGTTTRTGKEVLSGNGAYTARRVASLASGDITLDARTVDFAYTTGVLSNYTITLSDLGATDYVVFYLRHEANGGSTYTISANGGTLYVMNPTGTKKQTVQLVWDGNNWDLGLVGAAV